uniref:putative nuclease HARBI1 isoform X1 n=1 Tax=Epinephelus lanceolatus TaxID=310571 RepID=UPI00144822B8|nr:putative nuclease HARBI1 isoform X1 [Epinephelus lanceolatus]
MKMVKSGPCGTYCQLNTNVPIIRQFLDDTVDLRPNLRLSCRSLAALTAALNFSVTQGWPKDIEVLVFVCWLAHAAPYRVVSAACDIPKSTVHDIVHRVSKAVMGILGRTIRFPNPDQLENISAGFSRLAGCPALSTVVGAIDGCHVRIKPPTVDEQDYLNRKLFHSIQLQAICDHEGKFLDILVSFPGLVHDVRVLRNSPVYYRQLYPPEGWCILGDGDYPSLAASICLIMPYREPVVNPVQARFNSMHAKAWNIIE